MRPSMFLTSVRLLALQRRATPFPELELAEVYEVAVEHGHLLRAARSAGSALRGRPASSRSRSAASRAAHNGGATGLRRVVLRPVVRAGPSCGRMPPVETQQPDPGEDATNERLLSLLEQRRAAFEGVMWHVPALVVAAQAFLLQVITDDGVDYGAAVAVALAGSMASITAGIALHIQQERERWLNEQVKAYASRLRSPLPERDDAPMPGWGFALWQVTLGTFVVVDWLAVGFTH
jgi:hypothetical protein